MPDVQPCCFCGKTREQVKQIFVPVDFMSPGELTERPAICDECIILNMQVLATESETRRDEMVALLQAVEPKEQT